MVTFFTTAKPFRGHSGIIQRNALVSWKRLHPDAEVILFGNDEGAEEVSGELGLRHEPSVDQAVEKTRRADIMFRRAQEITRHEVLCYCNCDIVLMQDFCEALGRVKAARSQFLMVGRRWDAEVKEPLDFRRNEWGTQLRGAVLREGKQQTPDYIDYFVFSRGVLGADFPPLVVGRVFWDNWTVWQVLEARQPV